MQNVNQDPAPKVTVRAPNRLPETFGQQLKRMVVAIFIVLDCTGSMDEYIAGVIKALIRFSELLFEANLEPIIGLITFRDETYGERTVVYPLRTSLEKIREILLATKAEGGGDEPESSLPAIMRGVDGFDNANPEAKRVILHITDNPPHDPEAGLTSASVLKALCQKGIIYFACTPAIEPYKSLANKTGGTLFPLAANMDADAFKDVLLAVAHQTIKTVRRDGPVLTDEALDALRQLGYREE